MNNKLTLLVVARLGPGMSPLTIFSTIGWGRGVTAPVPGLKSTVTGLGTLRPFVPTSPGTMGRT